MRRFFVLLLLICVCSPAYRASAAVVINTNYTFARIWINGAVNDDTQTNPAGATAVATLPGGFTVTTSNLSTPVLSGSILTSRPGGVGDYGLGAVEVNFTTTTDATYTATGSFSSSAGLAHFYGFLRDLSVGSYLYNSDQANYYTGSGNVLNIGGSPGNTPSSFSGSLTGVLLAGHSYGWQSAGANSSGHPGIGGDNDLGAEASGVFSLSVTTTPEFSSVIVWSLVALSIGGAGWWQRSSSRRSCSA